jgi:phenylalanine-4-hydroxylase
MLPVDKVREIYYSIDEFSQIFDQSIKESFIDDGKKHCHKLG